MTLVEAAVETLHSAIAAERGGADRIELCANLNEGGSTPSAGLIAAVVQRVSLPVFVLIRPRGGVFVYSDDEIETMRCDMDVARELGSDGVVTGALRADGSVNVEHTRNLVKAAEGLPVTFHRAFDLAPNLHDALEQLIGAGVSRILTSGGAATAMDGADVIAALVGQAGERTTIVAAGSIREHNVRDVIARTRVREVHARLVDEMRMQHIVELVKSTD